LSSKSSKSETSFEIVELEEYSGSALLIYSVLFDGENETLFDKFLIENEITYPDEVGDILNKLEVIGSQTGLKGKWIKKDQGRFGDGICYMFDHPEKHLRLYFILFGNATKDLAIIIGGGGFKPSTAHSFQEVDELKDQNYLLRDIAQVINEAVVKGTLLLDEDGFGNEDDEPLIFKIKRNEKS